MGVEVTIYSSLGISCFLGILGTAVVMPVMLNYT